MPTVTIYLKKFNRVKQSGFTLLEILLALFVFAIMATIAAVGLHAVVEARTVTQEYTKNLAKIQMAMVVLENDINQIIDRPITDNTGKSIPSVEVDTKPNEYIEFTRAGFSNPNAKFPRSTLLRVGYILQKQQLIRRTWVTLDRLPDTKPSEKIILNGVSNFNINVIDDHARRIDHWPIFNQDQKSFPKAIEIKFCLAKDNCVSKLTKIYGSSLNEQTKHP